MEKIRVMHLLTPLTIAGAERVVINLSKNIDHEKFKLYICIFVNYRQKHNIFIEEVKRLQIEIEIIRLYKVFSFKQVYQLLKILNKNKIQILHTHSHRADIIGYLASRFYSVAIVSTLHGWTSSTGKLRFYEGLDRFFLKRFSRVIAVSNKIRVALIEHGMRPEKVVTIHNSLDFDAYDTHGDGAKFISEFGLEDCGCVVGYLGRLSVEKGCRYLLLAARELLNHRKDFKVVFVGDGPDRKKLEEMTVFLGLSNYVTFCGYRTDVSDFYKAIDIFVLPSLTEGVPICLLEAAYFEKPFVATRVGGVPELFDDLGLLVEPRGYCSIADSIVYLLNNKFQSRVYGKLLKEHVLKKGNPRLWASLIESNYYKLVKKTEEI